MFLTKLKTIVILLMLIFLSFSQIMMVYAEPILNTPEFIPGRSISNQYEMVAQSDSLQLFLNQETNTIAVQNLESGFFWFSGIDSPVEFRAGLGSQWRNRVLSLFELEYARIDDENVYFLAEKNTNVSIQANRIQSGVDFTIFLPEISIGFTLQILLDDDSMVVKIPQGTIREESTNRIISITPLPYFGSAMNTVNGYMVFPDGSGAVHEFKANHPEFLQGFRGYVYGEPRLNLDDSERFDTIMLPVFGVVKESDAFVGFIESGDSASRIQFSPSGFRVNINRIGVDFMFRHQFRVERSNVVARTTAALTTVVNLLDSTLLDSDKIVRYKFLSGDKANYSGMATTYRNFLLSRQYLVPSNGPHHFLSLDFLMGIEEPRILFNRSIVMTTTDEVRDHVTRLSSLGVESMAVNLLGWEDRGFRSAPNTVPVARRIGGRNGIGELSDFLNSHDWPLTLRTDLTRANRTNRGFSIYRDTVKNPLGLVVTDAFSQRYLISPLRSLDWLTSRILPYFRRVPRVGFHLDLAGQWLLIDRPQNELFTRDDAITTWHKMFDLIGGEGRYAVASGGGQFILSRAQRLFDIPIESAGFFFTDYSIPFYQIVVHGSIPYSGLPGNLSWNHQWHFLKWIEYGYLPHYQLTTNDPIELRKTQFSQLFNSTFDQWESTIADVYQQYTRVYKNRPGRFIDHHSRLRPEVYETRFSDGSRVIVNYNLVDVDLGSFIVPAMNFLFVDSEGVIR